MEYNKEKYHFEIRLRVQSFKLSNLKNFIKKLEVFAAKKNIISSTINLPIEKKKMTVLKSPHVNKKAKDQFEIRFYNRLVCLKSHSFEWQFFQDLKKELPTDSIVKISFLSNLSLCSN